ncbi:efflux RND transporter periplasmic adaptor subunit [Marinobacter orientalis]|uniref:Efflux RND transporter periplasmic adaptor subunit n=1 Tax=Marinobacter orientalis TaxID=1928859 RepID=A0A7Y0NK71_9GAMM|nr:efflux RND transporter periplasmic adaptor subunit [Marinobacter orientalis]TGX52071.1 efflux RND transporter periplasmic adaptor subunit [Marinobacter orientalis]
MVRQLVALAGLWCFALPQVQAQDRPGVELAPVETSDIISEVSLNGTVNALRTSELSTAVAGLVEDVRVETGDRVARGDLLVGLDDEQAEFELASARAEASEALARLEEAQRRLAEARSVGAGRNIAATEVSARESEVAATEAALARLRAEEKRRQVVLDRHRIEAPFDGVVSDRISDLGEWVTPGDQLLTLVDTTNLRLDFRVPQDYYQRITDDSRLLVQARGADQKPVPVTIESLVPVSDPQARTFLIRATAPEDLNVLPGMAVQATLRVSTGERGLTVSRDAINRYPDGRITVWIAEAVDEDLYEVREKRVEVGSGFDNRMEILSGLEGDEEVVIRGNESLEEGARVRLAERGSR